MKAQITSLPSEDSPKPPPPSAVQGLIATERARQDAKWGGPAHDDAHSVQEFVGFIHEHAEKAIAPGTVAEATCQRLIEVAALAVAAVESIWRKRPELGAALAAVEVPQVSALIAEWRKANACEHYSEDGGLCPRCRDAVIAMVEAQAAELARLREVCNDQSSRQREGTSRIPMSQEGWDCATCGHRHAGPLLANICVGCPCPKTKAEYCTCLSIGRDPLCVWHGDRDKAVNEWIRIATQNARDATARLEAAQATIHNLRAELEVLQKDAEWRREWHARLGRGDVTEGRFYEAIEALRHHEARQAEELRLVLASAKGLLFSASAPDNTRGIALRDIRAFDPTKDA